MTLVVTWLWQGLSIAVLAAILVRVLPRLNAATRHVTWWLALGTVLALPWIPAEPGSGLPVAPVVGKLPVGTGTMSQGFPAFPFPAIHLPAPPEWLVPALLVLYGALVCFNLWRMVAGIRLIVGLKNSSIPLAPSHQERLPLWTAQCGRGRRPALRMSETATSPCALGFGRPVILIPAALAATLQDRELDLIVAHEQAHLNRYDDWFRLLECLLVAFAGIHPAVRLIARQIDVEREAACDDRVVEMTGDPRRYAHCLATVAALVGQVDRAAAAVAPHALESRGGLRTRIVRLLDRGINRTTGLAPSAALASLAVLMLAVLASDRIPPVVTVGERRAVAPVASATAAPEPAAMATPSAGPLPRSSPAPLPVSPATSPRMSAMAARVRLAAVPSGGAAAGTRARRDVARPEAPSLGAAGHLLASPDPGDAGDSPWPHAAPAQAESAPPESGDGARLPLPLDSQVLAGALNRSAPGSVVVGATDSVGNRQAGDGSSTDVTLADRSVAAGQRVTRFGRRVGAASATAGTSVGRFFGRAGKAVASGF